jgi:hypothetical protein
MRFCNFTFCKKISLKKKIESYLNKVNNGTIQENEMHKILYEEILKICNNSFLGICFYHIPTFYKTLHKRYTNEFRCRIEN